LEQNKQRQEFLIQGSKAKLTEAKSREEKGEKLAAELEGKVRDKDLLIEELQEKLAKVQTVVGKKEARVTAAKEQLINLEQAHNELQLQLIKKEKQQKACLQKVAAESQQIQHCQQLKLGE